MEVILMNRNTEVLKLEISNLDFTKVIEVYNIDYAPIAINNAYNDSSKSLIKGN